MRKTSFVLVAALSTLLLAACSDDDAPPRNDAGPSEYVAPPNEASSSGCGTIEALPFGGTPAAAPTVTSVTLSCVDTWVEVAMIVTDPEGDGDLDNVNQTVKVFLDSQCAAEPMVTVDDLVGSGVEEYFPDYVEQPAARDAICAAVRWPVEVVVSDASGNQVSGRLNARVVQ